ncbi:protein phosphatase 2C domain-containing protein [Accumulibacter sp.]|uniref:protein phosphatase 2C domain-containing protein n=1 Tax=Accumulibacter sp. TaxID=2053492 RepID=UPI0035B270B0
MSHTHRRNLESLVRLAVRHIIDPEDPKLLVTHEVLAEFVQRDEAILAAEQFALEVRRIWDTHPKKVSFPDLAAESTASDTELPSSSTDSKASVPPASAPASEPVKTSDRLADPSRAQPGPPRTPPHTPAATRPNDPAPHPGAIPTSRQNTKTPPPRVSFRTERNARVGEDYDASVQTSARDVAIVGVKVPQGLGVVYDISTKRLKGNPTAAGDHVLDVFYRTTGADAVSSPDVGECHLVINPDPWSIWQEKDPAGTEPDPKPHTDRRLLDCAGERRIAAASKRGRSHAHVGGFRDDDFFVDVVDGWNILAVADGAGSAKRSRRGSQLAADCAGGYLSKALVGESGSVLSTVAEKWITNPEGTRQAAFNLVSRAVYEAVLVIDQEHKAAGVPVKEYATTLLLAIHRPLSSGNLIVAYWVGDGAIGLLRDGPAVTLLGEVDSGDFAGQTRFLDSTMYSHAEMDKRLRVEVVEDFRGLVLMTDGISDPWFETDNNLADPSRWEAFWSDQLEACLNSSEPDLRLLEWMDFKIAGNHDDRTLAVLW